MTAPHVVHSPGDDYPPSRPTLTTLVVALALVFGVLAIVFRSTLGL